MYFSVFLIFFYVDSNLDSTFSDADPNTSGLGLRRDGLGLSELDYIFSRQLKELLFFIQYIDNPSDVTQHSWISWCFALRFRVVLNKFWAYDYFFLSILRSLFPQSNAAGLNVYTPLSQPAEHSRKTSVAHPSIAWLLITRNPPTRLIINSSHLVSGKEHGGSRQAALAHVHSDVTSGY